MLNELFAAYSPVFLFFLSAFAVTAVVYLKRLIVGLAFRCRSKCTYHALWVIPYSSFLFHIALCQRIPNDCLFLMHVFWIFSLICAIIHSGFPVKKTKKWIWEAGMRHLICIIDGLRKLIFSIDTVCSPVSNKIRRFHPALQALLTLIEFCMVVALAPFLYRFLLVLCIPGYAPPALFLICYTVFFLFMLIRCISSCGFLILFWIAHIAIAVKFVSFSPKDIIFFNIIDSSFSVYCSVCVIITIFWCLSAGIADYDVAKMAGTIVNTFTTIVLIAVNIIFGWLQRVAGLVSSTDIEEAIYGINLIVFPIVMAGYLAVLFADGIDYWRKRHIPPAFGIEGPEDKTKQE